MADACRAFDAPVVSGNASLYNESDDGPVLPTPVIGMLGLLARPELAVRSAFQSEGDIVILLGAGLEQPAASLGASEYLAVRHNLSRRPRRGRPRRRASPRRLPRRSRGSWPPPLGPRLQ